MPKFTINKSSVILILLAILSSLFFGFVALNLVYLFGKHYVYLVALPAAFILGLVFIFNRYLFLGLVILSRSSLESIFEAIKFGSFGLGAVLNALVILIAILTFLEKPAKADVNVDKIKIGWSIFLALCFISIFYAPVAFTSIKVFMAFVSYFSMFVIGFNRVHSKEDLTKWLKVIAFSSVIPSIYAIISMLLGLKGFYYSLNEGYRLQSTFPHPNTYAPYLVIVITVCFYLWRTNPTPPKSKFKQLLLPAYILLLCFLLLMTKTRSTWVACYVFFLLYSVLHERKFLLPVLVAPFLALMVPEIRDRVITDLASGGDYGSTGFGRINSYAWRKEVWRDTFNFMSSSHYFLGYGLTSFLHYSTSIVKANAFELQKVEINVHSVYVQLFFELGIFGLLSFLYMLYAHISTLIRLSSRNRLLTFMVVALLIEYLFMSYSDNMLNYLVYQWYLWFTVGIAIGSLKKADAVKVTTAVTR